MLAALVVSAWLAVLVAVLLSFCNAVAKTVWPLRAAFLAAVEAAADCAAWLAAVDLAATALAAVLAAADLAAKLSAVDCAV